MKAKLNFLLLIVLTLSFALSASAYETYKHDKTEFYHEGDVLVGWFKLPLYYNPKVGWTLNIPDFITKIEKSPDKGERNPTIIKLPPRLVEIGRSALENQSISYIEFPNSLRIIGESAFWRCKNLKKISLPGSVQSIGEDAFHGCPLKTVILTNGMTEETARSLYDWPLKVKFKKGK